MAGLRSHLQTKPSQPSVFTPTQNPFQPRPFAPPVSANTTPASVPPLDLKTRLETARRLGHSFEKMVTQANGATADPILIQRYSKIGGGSYTMQGAVGDTMFESQQLDRTGGHHRYARAAKTQRADGRLDVQNQHYDTLTSSWQNAGGVFQEDLPPLNISRNGLLAIERTKAQPRGFYIEANLLTQSNNDLQNNTTGVIRLFPTGASIQIPVMPGHPWTVPINLQYVTLTTADQGTAAVGGAPDLTRIGVHACEAFTRLVTGVSARAPGTNPVLNRGAQITAIGENYDIQEEGRLANDSHGTMRNYSVAKPKIGKDDLQKMLIELDNLEQALEEKGISATEKWFYSNNVRALLDNWADHYEAAVAIDQPDLVTAVNYNRNTEARWERRRVFREYYRTLSQFRQNVRNQINLAHGGQVITWQQYRNLADQQVINLLNALGVAHANVVQELTDLQTTVANEATTMWYFSMYGPDKQSFHAKFAPTMWDAETRIK